MITSCLHGLWLDILNRKIIVLKVTEKNLESEQR